MKVRLRVSYVLRPHSYTPLSLSHYHTLFCLSFSVLALPLSLLSLSLSTTQTTRVEQARDTLSLALVRLVLSGNETNPVFIRAENEYVKGQQECVLCETQNEKAMGRETDRREEEGSDIPYWVILAQTFPRV